MARMLLVFGNFSVVLFSKIESVLSVWLYLYKHRDQEQVHTYFAWNLNISTISTKITTTVRCQPGHPHPNTCELDYSLGIFPNVHCTLQCSEDKLALTRRGEKKKVIAPLLLKIVGVGELSFKCAFLWHQKSFTAGTRNQQTCPQSLV